LYESNPRKATRRGKGYANILHKEQCNEVENTCQPLIALSWDDIMIQEALLMPAFNQFKILACAVDYYPFCLEDSVVFLCAKCNEV